VKHRKLGVFVGALLVLVVFGALAYVFITRNDGSDVITRTVRGAAGGGSGGDTNTISIYAPSQLSKPLERVTTAFQQEQPGTTFQFTLGPSNDLLKRIRDDQKPSVYIDATSDIAQLPAKARPTAAPVPFGYDMVQLAVKRGNPKGVGGLDVFGAGSPVATGICAPSLPCGLADGVALQRAGVNPAAKLVTENVAELTDGVMRGGLDAVLVLRTELRSVLTGITNVPIPSGSRVRQDFQMVQLRSGGPTDQFFQWVQGSPSARHALRFSGMLSFYDN
jgi:molybdate transport system substrate-binding protein